MYSKALPSCIKFGKRRGKQKAAVTTSCGFPDPLQNADLHKALPISNTFIQYQIHSSNIKHIHPISNTLMQHQIHSKDSNENDGNKEEAEKLGYSYLADLNKGVF